MNALEILSWAPLLRAQIEAEVKTRLRSTSTAFAVIAILVASFKWIPDPASGGVSMAWKDLAGQPTTSIYNSAYVGASAAILASLFLSLIGFYLVTGSIRRDRDSGVGAILAATPLSKAAYLGGKIAAHAVYLWTIGLVALLGGLLVFARFGVGPLEPLAFLLPWLLFVAPALLFVAAVAVFFDATPGLRGKAGLVIYFFTWTFGFLLIPGLLSGSMNPERGEEGQVAAPATPVEVSPPYYDPTAVATVTQMLQESTPSVLGEVSLGLQYGMKGLVRVDWPGFRYPPRIFLLRLLNLVWMLIPFGLAYLFFDRFDPARKQGKARQEKKARAVAALDAAAAEMAPKLHLATLPAVHCQPSALRAILAEAKLLWDSSGLLRFLLPLAALAAAAPGEAGLPGAAVLLLLLGPAIAELAARESLAGTWPLILGQPGVPRSTLWWKLAAALVFLGLLGLPRLLTSLVHPELAAGWLLGLVFIASFAVAAGALTGGGKLFIGVYVALWYVALNGAPFADFAAALSPAPALATSALFAAAGLGFAAIAWVVERRRYSFA